MLTAINYSIFFFFLWRCAPTRAMASSFLRFLDHTQRRTKVGRTPLYERSARRRDLYLHNTQHSQQTNIHASGGIQTHDLSRRAAADLRLRPRGHWDRHTTKLPTSKMESFLLVSLSQSISFLRQRNPEYSV